MPLGCGAWVLHSMLEAGLDGYRMAPYNPWLTLFPPLLRAVGWRQPADIIHATPDYAPFVARRGKPLVVTIHHTMFDDFMRPYSSALQRIHYRTDLRWFTQWGIRRAQAVTAVSRFSADLARQSLDIEQPIRVIYNGVDEAFFRPPRERRASARIRVLFTGNLSRRKGAHWLAAIADRLDDGIEILYTRGLRGNSGLPDHPRLKCLGNIPYPELPRRYASADIFLFPSVREGFGLAVAEAMACGLPVVATNGSALPELIDHGRGGFLCSVGDVDCFARQINRLASMPALRREMGQYNRQRVEERFTRSRMIRQYRELFEQVSLSTAR